MLTDREDILRGELEQNQNETTLWEKYKKEQEIAIQNLELFSKRLTVDVMVEMGKKALIPAKLIHTNEVMVSHFEGYFSNCSAFQAKQICEMRLKKSEKHLEKLQAEAQMWQDRLQAPYDEGVFPSEGQVDIVEEYDEETEKQWRELHRKRVREYKMREKSKRWEETEEVEEVVNENEQMEQNSSQERLGAEVFSKEVQIIRNLQSHKEIAEEKLLEENVKMEQDSPEAPQKEILSLEKSKNQTIRNLLCNDEIKEEELLAGNVKIEQDTQDAPPEEIFSLEKSKDLEKIFHDNAQREQEQNEIELIEDNTISIETIKELMGDNNVTQKKRRVAHVANPDGTKKNDVNKSVILTNKDLVLIEQDDLEGDIHSEVKDVLKQAKALPLQDQFKYLKKHLEMFEEDQLQININSSEDVEKRIHIQEICDQLWDVICSVKFITNDEIVLEISDDENTNTGTKIEEKPAKKKLKKSVSFSFEDGVLEYRKIDAVADMLKFKEPLNVGEYAKVKNKKEQILKKVEDNLKYISENQSIQNCNLIEQLITESTNEIITSYIHVKHSSAPSYKNISNDNNNHDEIPTSPADMYSNYLKICDVNSKNCIEVEADVKVPILCEKDRIQAFKSQKAEFSVPKNSHITSTSSEGKAFKSILRNKPKVMNEKPESNKMQVKPVDVDTCSGIFDKVVKDVKEHEEPDPLPKEKFVDSCAPRKRISHFKRDRKKLK